MAAVPKARAVFTHASSRDQTLVEIVKMTTNYCNLRNPHHSTASYSSDFSQFEAAPFPQIPATSPTSRRGRHCARERAQSRASRAACPGQDVYRQLRRSREITRTGQAEPRRAIRDGYDAYLDANRNRDQHSENGNSSARSSPRIFLSPSEYMSLGHRCRNDGDNFPRNVRYCRDCHVRIERNKHPRIPDGTPSFFFGHCALIGCTITEPHFFQNVPLCPRCECFLEKKGGVLTHPHPVERCSSVDSTDPFSEDRGLAPNPPPLAPTPQRGQARVQDSPLPPAPSSTPLTPPSTPAPVLPPPPDLPRASPPSADPPTDLPPPPGPPTDPPPVFVPPPLLPSGGSGRSPKLAILRLRRVPGKAKPDCLDGYHMQSVREFEAFVPDDRRWYEVQVGKPDFATVVSSIRCEGDARVSSNRSVKMIDKDIVVAEVTARRVFVNPLAIASFIASYALPLAALASRGQAHNRVPALLAGFFAVTAFWSHFPANLAGGLLQFRRLAQKSQVYCPHLLANALLEYRAGEDVSSNIDQKLLRQGSLPIPDAVAVQLQRGTAAAARAVQESGSETQGFACARVLSLQHLGGRHL